MDNRRSPLMLGIAAFALTFALIITLTFLGIGIGALRKSFVAEPTPSPSATPTSSEPAPVTESPVTEFPVTKTPAVVAPTNTPSPSASASPLTVGGDYCYRFDGVSLPKGNDTKNGTTLSAGGLITSIPSPFSASSIDRSPALTFTPESAAISTEVEPNWASHIALGKLQWQPGYAYPGNERAAERLFDCIVNNTLLWEPQVPARTLENQKKEAVTIDGMKGFKVTGRLHFTTTLLKETTHDDITVVVLETANGPAVYASIISSNPTIQEAAQKSLADLRAAS